MIQQIKDHFTPEFRPFTVHLSDGRNFTVHHRDSIAVDRRTIAILDEAGAHVIATLHIVSVDEPHQPAEA